VFFSLTNCCGRERFWAFRQFLQAVQPEVVQELGGDAVEGGLARRVFASDLLNQPAGEQLAHGMAAVHPAQGVYLGLG
jgi:hypothetical protein